VSVLPYSLSFSDDVENNNSIIIIIIIKLKFVSLYLWDMCPGGDYRPSAAQNYEFFRTQIISPAKIIKTIVIILIIIQLKTS
jgi:hypothetical protein